MKTNKACEPTWRILHVDDDEDDHVLVRMMLAEARGRPVEVDWAATFEEGRRKLRANAYEAVLVDYDLGTATGIQLIEEFFGRGYSAPLILLTGRGSYEVDVEAMRAGATLYLTKAEMNPLLLERLIRYAIERNQAERELRKKTHDLLERDRKLSIALDAARLGTWTYTFADRMLEADERAQQLYGTGGPRISHDEIVRTRLHSDDVEAMWAAVGRAADPAGNGRYRVEYRIRQPGGSWRWLSVWGQVEFEGQGANRRAARLTGASRDITEEKQAREAIHEREARFRQLADAMPQLVWTANPDGTVDYYNQRYRLYGGIDQDAGSAWAWAPSLHPDDLPATLEAWQAALRSQSTYQIEHRVRMADGSYRWHLSRGIPAYDEQGRLVKWYGTATDIDELKQAQQMLHYREQRMRRLFDSNIFGIVSRDADMNVIEANDSFLEIAGYTREQFLKEGLNIRTLTPPEYHELDDRCTQEVLSSGLCRPYEKEYLRRDGRRVPVMVGYSLLQNGQSEFIGFVMDMTELKRAQAGLAEYAEKLKRSNEDLERFAFVASHDLQEPLRKITLFGSALRQQMGGQLAPEAEDYLRRMEQASERMRAMIHGLLELSRISTQASQFELVDLTRLAEEVVSDLEGRIHSTGGEVTIEPLPTVIGDPLQLAQLLQNLVSNGLKFHKPGQAPRVHISGGLVSVGAAPFANIVVEDTGIGFEPSQADQIFQPFIRLHGRSAYEGTGMGLAICRKIVERHSGTIHANSKPGEGSRFTVTLPLRP